LQIFCFIDYEITIRINESKSIINDIEKIFLFINNRKNEIFKYDVQKYDKFYDVAFKLNDKDWDQFINLISSNTTELDYSKEQIKLHAFIKYRTEQQITYAISQNLSLSKIVKSKWSL
jgi:hypothetical protein